MTNLDFLQKGKIFPPIEEAKRIGSYYEYDLLVDGNSYASEKKAYRKTINAINKLAQKLGWGEAVSVEYNYYKLNSKKKADFIVGEIPEIIISNDNEALKQREQEVVNAIRNDMNVRFDTKLWDAFFNMSKYGVCPLRVYVDENGKNTFTLNKPHNIIKIVDSEDLYRTKCYVVYWTEKDRLNVRIHYKGYYEIRTFKVRRRLDGVEGILASERLNDRYTTSYPTKPLKSYAPYTVVHDLFTGEYFRWYPYEIIDEIIDEQKRVETGLDDFAIVEIENLKDSDGVYGASDYDDYDSIIAQNQLIASQIQLIFDRFTLPTAYGDEGYLAYDQTGERVFEIGTYLAIPSDGVPPAFLEPDLSKLQQYFSMLSYNDVKIKELSEMGAVYGTDSEASSGISTETMKARFMSAIKSAQRITAREEIKLKQLIHLISSYGYGLKNGIPIEDITITFYDGLPNDELQEENIVTARLNNGTTSRKREMTERQSLTVERAEEIIAEKIQEDSDFATINAMNMFAGVGANGGANNEPSIEE